VIELIIVANCTFKPISRFFLDRCDHAVTLRSMLRECQTCLLRQRK